MTLCSSGLKVYGYDFKGKHDHNLSGKPARTGREQRYPELRVLEGCGMEAKQGEPARTSGPTEACPAFNIINI
jgi:hypothetical protein